MNPWDILLPVLVVAAIALIAGIGLGIANRFMAVKENAKKVAIVEALPGANCGACGFSGCQGYAEALASENGNVKKNLCVVGGDAVAAKISEILGVEAGSTAKVVAQVNCRGTADEAKANVIYVGVSSCKAACAVYGGDKACRYGCIGFGDCVKACEFEAIRVCNGVAVVSSDACRGCGKCATVCPRNVITIVPAGKKAAVLCSNPEKGPATKAVCGVGCLGCRMCAKVCEAEAISFVDFRAVVDRNKCVGCGKCREACKFGVISLQ